jgi:hypothetical protein
VENSDPRRNQKESEPSILIKEILRALFRPPDVLPPPEPPTTKEMLWEALKLDPYANTEGFKNYDEWYAAAKKQLSEIRLKAAKLK